MKVTLISATDQPERHIEACARVCYESQDRIGEDTYVRFLNSLLQRGHLSVFEHAFASFYIEGISRATSHQLVRHRIASYSQKSQRYVKEDGFDYTVPDDVQDNPEALRLYKSTVETIRAAYQQLTELGIKKEDARFLLPNATHTSLVMTADFREWFNVIDLRVSPHAQWEIRRMTTRIWKLLYEIAPVTFGLEYFKNWSKDYAFKEQIFHDEIK